MKKTQINIMKDRKPHRKTKYFLEMIIERRFWFFRKKSRTQLPLLFNSYHEARKYAVRLCPTATIK